MSFTKDQLALQAHIEQENAEHADSYFSVTADLDHWAEYDITTIAQYEHYMAVEDYIDCFKSVNGIKPRWMDFDSMTVAQLRVEADALSEQWQGQAEYEAEHDAWLDSVEDENHKYNELNSDPEATKYELIAEKAGF
jgi:uncharacterized protein YukE